MKSFKSVESRLLKAKSKEQKCALIPSPSDLLSLEFLTARSGNEIYDWFIFQAKLQLFGKRCCIHKSFHFSLWVILVRIK